MMSSELVTPGTEYAPSDTASRLLLANVHIVPCKLQNNFSFFPPLSLFFQSWIHSFFQQFLCSLLDNPVK